MTGHEDIQSVLPAFALDAVEPEEREEIEGHLVVCAICRNELEVLRGDVAAFDKSVEPPEGLWNKVAERFRRR